MEKKENYNMIISGMILAKEESFEYDEILKEVQERLGDDPEVETVLNSCLLRMMNDNYLKSFNTIYTTIYTIEHDSLVEGSDRLDLNLSINELSNRINQLNEKKKEIDKEIESISNELLTRAEDIIPNLIKEINEKISLINALGFAITDFDYELLSLDERINVKDKEVCFIRKKILY